MVKSTDVKAAIYQLSNQVSNTCAPFRYENAQWRKVKGHSGEKQGGNVLHVIQLFYPQHLSDTFSVSKHKFTETSDFGI